MQSFPISHSLLRSIKKVIFMPNAKQESWHLGHLIVSSLTRKIGNYLNKNKKKNSNLLFFLFSSCRTIFWYIYVHNSWILPEASCDQSPSFTAHCKVHWGEMFIKKGLEITLCFCQSWTDVQSIPKPSLPSLMASFSSLWSSS